MATPSTPAAAATPEEPPPLPDAIREILEDVAEVRGLEAPPALHALTVARSGVENVYTGLVGEEDRRRIDDTTKLYRLLGYLDEDEHLWDITLSFLDAVLGFYSSDHKILWVVTDKEGVGLDELDRGQRETLAHEIIHALQDYHFDLNATYDIVGDNLDRELAFTAVVEGDAVVHTDRYSDRFLSVPGGGGLYFLASANQLGGIPAPIIRELYFPYTTGARWAGGVLADEGAEGLDAFLAEPPPATTLILHPELMDTGWEPEWIYDSFLPERQIRGSLGLGWHTRLSGSIGEFHLLNYLVGNALFGANWLYDPGNRTAIDAAAGWAGDRYYLFEHSGEDGQAVMVARVRFAGEEDAREFARTHRSVATRRAEVVEEDALTLATRPDGNVVALIEPVGRDVIFAIGTSAEVVRAALEPLLKG